jgi:hypothetical protein
LNVDYGSIPKFLTNGKGEVELLSGSSTIELTPDLHNYLIDGILNPMIVHLNRGREISGDPAVELFVKQQVPPAVELSRLGKVASDYYDVDVAEHWRVIVASEIPKYLLDYSK